MEQGPSMPNQNPNQNPNDFLIHLFEGEYPVPAGYIALGSYQRFDWIGTESIRRVRVFGIDENGFVYLLREIRSSVPINSQGGKGAS